MSGKTNQLPFVRVHRTENERNVAVVCAQRGNSFCLRYLYKFPAKKKSTDVAVIIETYKVPVRTSQRTNCVRFRKNSW